MPLTDAKIKATKPTAKLAKLSDAHGLQLWVYQDGAKRWRYGFRYAGAQKTLSLGVYPEVSLLEARAAMTDARKLVKNGIDPSQHRRVERQLQADANANTFDLLAAEFIDKKRREGRAESTVTKITWLLGLASPMIGQRPISEIKPREVLAALKLAENRGKLETAHRMRSVIGEVFRFAIQSDRAENDPTFALRGALIAPIVRHRAAIIEPQAVGELLRAIESYDTPSVRWALELLMLTMKRPGELRLSQWSEFDFDKCIWIIPRGRMKARDEHRLPLPRQVVERFRSLKQISGDSALVFPSFRGIGRPMSEATMNAALKRLGYSSEQVQPHGFRTTASSILNESGLFSSDAIERALSHKDKDAIRGIYARGSYWDERVRMAQYWADYLDKLREGGKVIPFTSAAVC